MGDRTNVFFKFGGKIEESVLMDLIKLIIDANGIKYHDWEEFESSAEAYNYISEETYEIVFEECNYGNQDRIEEFLKSNELCYSKYWDPGHSYSSGMEMYIYGKNLYHCNAIEWEPVISITELKSLIKDDDYSDLDNKLKSLETQLPKLEIIP